MALYKPCREKGGLQTTLLILLLIVIRVVDAFHEWVGDVHFYVFVNDLVECVYRHFLNVA